MTYCVHTCVVFLDLPKDHMGSALLLVALPCFAVTVCFALLCIASRCFAVFCFALLGLAVFCVALLCFALLCFALLYSALLCIALLCNACFALFCIVWLCFALPCVALICNACVAWQDFLLLCFALSTPWENFIFGNCSSKSHPQASSEGTLKTTPEKKQKTKKIRKGCRNDAPRHPEWHPRALKNSSKSNSGALGQRGGALRGFRVPPRTKRAARSIMFHQKSQKSYQKNAGISPSCSLKNFVDMRRQCTKTDSENHENHKQNCEYSLHRGGLGEAH